jgi:hypothetical protein
VTTAIIGAAGGVGLNLHWHFIPAGPAIVLVLFAEFVVTYVASVLRRA